ncbi:thrombopoietin-like [Pelodytes ibericus]
MDVNRIYLLIILVLSPDVSRMSPSMRCHRLLLDLYMNRTYVMERTVAQCEDQKILQFYVTLPNVEIRIADWQNMTESQQSGEVLAHLRVLLDATQKAKASDCISLQLRKLTQNIKEITGLIKKLLKKDASFPQEVPLHLSSSLHTSTSDSTEIIQRFLKLLQGKVNFILQRLRKVSCR